MSSVIIAIIIILQIFCLLFFFKFILQKQFSVTPTFQPVNQQKTQQKLLL